MRQHVLLRVTTRGCTASPSSFEIDARSGCWYLTDVSDLTCGRRSFTTESMDPDATMIYAYYKEGSSNPTFLYPVYALKAEKC